MVIENQYNLGDIVYLITDVTNLPRMVIEIRLTKNGTTYALAQGEETTVHYEIELSKIPVNEFENDN
jgi:hypothetical protein